MLDENSQEGKCLFCLNMYQFTIHSNAFQLSYIPPIYCWLLYSENTNKIIKLKAELYLLRQQELKATELSAVQRTRQSGTAERNSRTNTTFRPYNMSLLTPHALATNIHVAHTLWQQHKQISCGGGLGSTRIRMGAKARQGDNITIHSSMHSSIRFIPPRYPIAPF